MLCELGRKDILIDTKKRARGSKESERDNVAVDTDKMARKKEFIRVLRVMVLRILDERSKAESKAKLIIDIFEFSFQNL
jgi:hypothetical protein